ncbi:MAG: transposase, partial [Eubacteriales bacterium]
HVIIPAGGLSLDQRRWISSRKKFFIPIKVISSLFKGKFMAYYKKACINGKIKFEGELEVFNKNKNNQSLINGLYKKQWVVYIKEPFSNTTKVMEYLGRYTHRVAISNQRIVNIREGKVSFKWKDYADKSKNKIMVLDGEEFIRRFLLHILPENFMKIRHYGILSNRSRKAKLGKCQEIFKLKQQPVVKISWQELLLKLKGIDVTVCPSCGKGQMVKRELLVPRACSPPKNHFVA